MRKILIALDGSERAESALPVAEALAHKFQAELHLVRVTEPYMIAPPGMMPAMALRVEEMQREAARPYLEKQVREVIGRGVNGRAALRAGAARHELLEAAEEADLLVMASHGRSGVARWLLGSIAESVLRHAPCPVLLVRGETTRFRKLLLPLDGSEQSLGVLPLAAALADPEAQATLLRASDVESLPLDVEQRRAVVSALAAELEAVTVPGIHSVTRRVEDSSPGESILAVAESEGSELICMTSHGRTGVGRWLLGSVAERVARYAPCSVLVVRAKNPQR